jgi:hypothetical protein
MRGRKEALEEARLVVWRDARTMVGDRPEDVVRFLPHRKADRATFGRKLLRVG